MKRFTVIASILVLLLLICGAVYKNWNPVEPEYYAIGGVTHQLLYANSVYICVPRGVTVAIKHGSTCVIDGYEEFTVKRNKIYTLGESGIVEEEYSKERLDRIMDTL